MNELFIDILTNYINIQVIKENLNGIYMDNTGVLTYTFVYSKCMGWLNYCDLQWVPKNNELKIPVLVGDTVILPQKININKSTISFYENLFMREKYQMALLTMY